MHAVPGTQPYGALSGETATGAHTPQKDPAAHAHATEAPQAHAHGKYAWMSQAFGCLGIIYGDIGTSPLYVFSSIFPSEQPSQDDVLGSLSLILWALILVCCVKYICLILLADSQGEGGTFALLSLLRQGILEFAWDHPYLQRALQDRRHALRLDAQGKDDEDDTDVSVSPRSSQSSAGLVREQLDFPLSPSVDGVPLSFESVPQPTSPTDHARLVPSSLSTRWERVSAYFFVRIDGVMTLLSFLAAGLLMGDGVLTPAISILSAIEGLVVVRPALQSSVVPIACVIILLLFLGQRFGTAKVSIVFSPIMMLWFVTLFILGLYNTSKHPAVLAALSPHHGILFFIRRGSVAWTQLGAVVLCVTGVEAMYADLGHFGARAVRTSWLFVVLPALLTTYTGQAAVLCLNPSYIDHAFFRSIPDPLYWPMLLLSTAATIIASQALISGSFSLISAAIKLRFLPHLRLQHTSDGHEGQIYLPTINYLLMTATIMVVLIFQKSALLANAYGLAVCFVMLITTVMYAVVVGLLWRKSTWVVAAWCVPFLFIDLGFLSANIGKIVNGGYLPVIFASVVAGFMTTWNWGRTQLQLHAKRHSHDNPNLPADALAVHVPSDDAELLLALSAVPTPFASDLDAGGSVSIPIAPRVSMVSCVGVFLTSSEEHVPHSAWQLLARMRSFPAFSIFLTIRFTQRPFEPPEQRMRIRTISAPGQTCEKGARDSCPFELYRVVCSYGFAEHRVRMRDIIATLFPLIEERRAEDSVLARHGGPDGPDANIFELDSEWVSQIKQGASPLPSPFATLPTAGGDTSPLAGSAETARVAPFPVTYYLSTEILVAAPSDDAAPRPTDDSAANTRAPAGLLIRTRGLSWSLASTVSNYPRWLRSGVQRVLVTAFNLIARNSDSAVAYFDIPTESVIEMGARIQLQ